MILTLRLVVMVGFIVSVLRHAPVDACTTFLLSRGKEVAVGKSYDWDQGQGLVLINKSGVRKRALLLDFSQKAATWVSRYASLTFNQYGREMPNGGMNQAGLVVEVSWLEPTAYPRPDARAAVTELQFVQYLLDRCATVADVAKAASEVRVSSVYARLHYLACDRSRSCTALEYLEGKLLVTPPERMPATVLTNHSYRESAEFLRRHKGFGGSEAIPTQSGSLERFVRAAAGVAGPKGSGTLEDNAFAILDSVAQGDFSKWNIVYDPVGLRVAFRTRKTPKVKTVALDRFASDCTAPVKVLDMDAGFAGDATDRFQDYTVAVNERLIGESLKSLKGILPGAAAILARYPDILTCRPTD